MLPTLLPGDRLRVDTRAYHHRRPHEGEIVVLRDPGSPARWLVKRVGSVGGEGLTLASDNPGSGRDSRQFGEVRFESLVGRAYARYAPRDRRGPL